MTAEFGSATIKMIGYLVLIVGLIICLAYGLKRFRPGGLSRGRSPVMKLIGTLNLAPKRAVALIEVCDQWLLIGVGTESVNLISKVESPPTGESTGSVDAGGEKGFQSVLRNKSLLQAWKNRTGERPDDKS